MSSTNRIKLFESQQVRIEWDSFTTAIDSVIASLHLHHVIVSLPFHRVIAGLTRNLEVMLP